MPGVAVAGRLIVDSCIAVVHGQVECDKAVASGIVESQPGRRIGRSGVGSAVPGVAVAGCEGQCTLGAVAYRQV